jgi:hypothetical protein
MAMAVGKKKAFIWINYNCSIQRLRSRARGLDFDRLAGERVLKPDAVGVQEKALARRVNFVFLAGAP